CSRLALAERPQAAARSRAARSASRRPCPPVSARSASRVHTEARRSLSAARGTGAQGGQIVAAIVRSMSTSSNVDAATGRSESAVTCSAIEHDEPASEEVEAATFTQSHLGVVELLEGDTRVFLEQLCAFPQAQARSQAPSEDPVLTADQATTDRPELPIDPSDHQVVRMWTDRLPLHRRGSGAAALLATATNPSVPVQLAVLGGDSTHFGVVAFRNGIYRGQLDRADQSQFFAAGESERSAWGSESDNNSKPSLQPYESELFVPHGYGVWTGADGSTRCGQWTQGEQIGPGTQQLRGVMAYEGEWVGDVPAGAGIATFADGQSFAGQWAGGRPYGLGALYTPTDCVCDPNSGDAIGIATGGADTPAGQMATRLGWFYGTQCLESCSTRIQV
ncbi:hypothetical protein PybrP1_011100, partial [[Pythium] brassicae (nom. inval.)]